MKRNKKIFLVFLIVLFQVGLQDEEKVTTVDRSRVLLGNRKRRYLAFPAGSSFIITLSNIKSLMIKNIPGLRFAIECDVPFNLPSNLRLHRKGLKKGANHSRQRREIFQQFSEAFRGLGFDGDSCVHRIVCEIRSYISYKGTSMVKDLLLAIFKFDTDDEYITKCEEGFSHCEFSFLSLLEGLQMQ